MQTDWTGMPDKQLTNLHTAPTVFERMCALKT